MLTLAIDTSCLTATCSVTEDGKVLAEMTVQQSKTHSQKLVPMLKSMLNILDKDFKDMDLFAAAIGPGSFTGLRIGAVTIKGLAYSCNKPVCGIPWTLWLIWFRTSPVLSFPCWMQGIIRYIRHFTIKQAVVLTGFPLMWVFLSMN